MRDFHVRVARERLARLKGPDAETEEAADLCHGLGRILDSQGRLGEVKPLYERAIAIWEKARGSDDALVAIGVNDLAWLLKQQGKLDEAKPLMERALAIDE